MAQSDETHEVRIALLESGHSRLERSLESLIGKMDQRFEELTKATQTLNETIIRAESVKSDVEQLAKRVTNIEAVTSQLPVQGFKTKTLWDGILMVVAIIVAAVIGSLLTQIGINR